MMPYYFNAADVVVQTSLFEASPMVIKEAMAVNVPLVTTDVGDSALVLGNTPGCFVCSTDPRDIALCIDQALDFGQRTVGRERIIQLGLSLEQVAKRYVTVYNQILSHGKSSQVKK
jgi:teichuronic acid biosynthesis glycosyltransferase TuaC